MISMFSMPREKRNDPTAIQELMESMSETDRKVMNFFFSGREAFEKVDIDLHIINLGKFSINSCDILYR
jgi:hypothetical protein